MKHPQEKDLMHYINLSPEFFLHPEIPQTTIRFPSGLETTIRVGECPKQVTITCIPENASDLFLIAQAADAAQRQGAKRISLILPFVPNARQDRSTCNGDAFGLKVFADFLNRLNFHRVTVFDPHSAAVELLINNCKAVPAWEFAQRVLKEEKRDYKLVAPDAGSLKKVDLLSQKIKKEVILCNKKRSSQTGEITGIEVYGDVNKSILYICDDICDGGATFILLSKKLYELGAAEVHLIVSHGIFSKGLDCLHKAGIKSIITTNSFNHQQHLFGSDVKPHEYLQVFDIRGLLI